MQIANNSLENEFKIEEISGLAKNLTFEEKTHYAFMGISIRNRFFSKDTIAAYVKWMSSNFIESLIVLVDDPDRFNLMVFKDLSEEEALQKARDISDETKNSYQNLINKLNITNVKVIQFRDFNNDPLFNDTYEKVKELIAKNTELKIALLQEMEKNIGYRIASLAEERGLKVEEIETVRSLLFRYIEYEAALLVFLTEKGYRIEIDPHEELEAKRLIYEKALKNPINMRVTERGHLNMIPLGTTYNPSLNGFS